MRRLEKLREQGLLEGMEDNEIWIMALRSLMSPESSAGQDAHVRFDEGKELPGSSGRSTGADAAGEAGPSGIKRRRTPTPPPSVIPEIVREEAEDTPPSSDDEGTRKRDNSSDGDIELVE